MTSTRFRDGPPPGRSPAQTAPKRGARRDDEHPGELIGFRRERLVHSESAPSLTGDELEVDWERAESDGVRPAVSA